MRRTLFALLLSGLIAGALVQPALAEIVNITGSTSVSVQEVNSGLHLLPHTGASSLSDPNAVFPLQSFTQVVSSDADVPSAAASAAQLENPLLAQPNPEEFALNMTLESVTSSISQIGSAQSQEIRSIMYSPAELGSNVLPGSTQFFEGQLTLDGALAMLAADSSRDLTGASEVLSVTVVKRVSGQDDQTVFQGSLSLVGSPDATAELQAGGDFPTRALILTDLGSVTPDFGVFRLAIIPSITIAYSYTAVVGQPFDLVATVRLDANNLPDRTAIAAVIGSATDTLGEVLGTSNGTAASAKVIDAIQRERQSPTGQLAFPQSPALAAGNPASACGLLGFEYLLMLAGMVGLRTLKFSRPAGE